MSIQGKVETKWDFREGIDSHFDLKMKYVLYDNVELHFNISREIEIEQVTSQLKDQVPSQMPKLGVIWAWGWLAKTDFDPGLNICILPAEASFPEMPVLVPDVSDWSEFQPIIGKPLYLLVISTSYFLDKKSYSIFYCLVVRKADIGPPFKNMTCYQRIGRYKCTVPNDITNKFMSPFDEEEIFIV